MKVFFAADHAGFELKRELLSFVASLGHEAEDLGAHALDPEDDYPDFVTPCAQRVAKSWGSQTSPTFGIVIGGSGQGEAMAANRISGVRAAVFYGGSLDIVRLAREHNDANILSLGARFVSVDEAKEAVRLFLDTPFSDSPHHTRRLAKF